jgi:hypothetical protein
MEHPLVTYCTNNPEQAQECNIAACPCCGGLGVAARCPSCDGAGAIMTRTLREAQLAHVTPFEKCATCNGRGYFPITTALFERLGFNTYDGFNVWQPRKPARRA